MESKAIIEEVKTKPRKESTSSSSSTSTSSSIEEDKTNHLIIDKNAIDIEYQKLKHNSEDNFEKFVSEIEEVKVIPKKSRTCQKASILKNIL